MDYKNIRCPVHLVNESDIYAIPIVLIFFLFFFIFFGRFYHDNNKKILTYFWLALSVRIAFSFLRTYIIESGYISSGDTYCYFYCIKTAWHVFFENSSVGLELIFDSYTDLSPEALSSIRGMNYWRNDPTRAIVRIGSVFNLLLAVNSYQALSLIFTMFGFLGSWKIFRVFYRIYPEYTFYLSVVILYFPTVLFYSTNIFKDPIALYLVGTILFNLYNIFIYKKNIIFNVICIMLAITIFLEVKTYILLSILLSFFAALFLSYNIRVKGFFLKKTFKFVLLIFGVITVSMVGYLVLTNSSSLTFEKILSSEEKLDVLGQYSMDSGSRYTLPTFQLSPSGIIYMILSSNVTTYFRPFLWEIKSTALVPIGLEAIFTTVFMCFILFRRNLFLVYKTIVQDRNIIFCLIFSLVLGAVVGLFSFTFGTLARYKLSCIIFFQIALVLIYFKSSPKKKLL